MHVVGEPGFPVPHFFQHTEVGCRSFLTIDRVEKGVELTGQEEKESQS